MPHGEDVERTAELEATCLRGEPERELDQVREALVAFPLEVVLGRPQGVVAEVVHELGDVARRPEGLGELLVAIAAGVGRRALPSNVLELDLSDVVFIATANVPGRRITRSVKELRRHLPESMPLSGLSIGAVADRVVVKEGSSRWQAAASRPNSRGSSVLERFVFITRQVSVSVLS